LHHQTIITILEVLLYDPLYDWTVSTAEANKRQKDEHDGSEMSNVSMYGGRDEGGFRGTWDFFARNLSDFFNC
jgi:phosphatidylinositol kinase/protein kinase (PI-3  family)